MRALCLSLAVLAASGCGSDGPGRFNVTGKVTFRGQPVEEGKITFEDPAAGQVNSADLGAGGGYSVELAAGDYQVSVSPPLIEMPGTRDSPGDTVPKNVKNIPKKYRVPES